jgi:hypothetical protein
MKRTIIYDPQFPVSAEELAHVLKVFTFTSYPAYLRNDKTLFKIYDDLPPEAKRHFKVNEEPE